MCIKCLQACQKMSCISKGKHEDSIFICIEQYSHIRMNIDMTLLTIYSSYVTFINMLYVVNTDTNAVNKLPLVYSAFTHDDEGSTFLIAFAR